MRGGGRRDNHTTDPKLHNGVEAGAARMRLDLALKTSQPRAVKSASHGEQQVNVSEGQTAVSEHRCTDRREYGPAVAAINPGLLSSTSR